MAQTVFEDSHDRTLCIDHCNQSFENDKLMSGKSLGTEPTFSQCEYAKCVAVLFACSSHRGSIRSARRVDNYRNSPTIKFCAESNPPAHPTKNLF